MKTKTPIFAGPVGLADQVFRETVSKENAESCVVMVNPTQVYQEKLAIAKSDQGHIAGDENDVYFMASIGKILTARTAVEYFKDKGGLDLKISDLLTEYSQGKSSFIDQLKLTKDFDKITVVDLLRHTSGIGQFTEESFAELSKNTERMMSFEDVLTLKTRDGKYGEFQYSNAGYELLALVLEHHSKQKFEDLQRDLVLKPLDLENEIFLRDQITKDEKRSYQVTGREDLTFIKGKNFDGKTEHDLINFPFRAGACMYAKPTAVAKLATKIWKTENIAELEKYEVQDSPSSKYGIGYSRNLNDGTIKHDGGMEGSRGTVVFNPTEQKAVCVIATLENKTPKIAEEELSKSKDYATLKTYREQITAFQQKYEDPNSVPEKEMIEYKNMENEFGNLEKSIEVKRKEIIDGLRMGNFEKQEQKSFVKEAIEQKTNQQQKSWVERIRSDATKGKSRDGFNEL